MLSFTILFTFSLYIASTSLQKFDSVNTLPNYPSKRRDVSNSYLDNFIFYDSYDDIHILKKRQNRRRPIGRPRPRPPIRRPINPIGRPRPRPFGPPRRVRPGPLRTRPIRRPQPQLTKNKLLERLRKILLNTRKTTSRKPQTTKSQTTKLQTTKPTTTITTEAPIKDYEESPSVNENTPENNEENNENVPENQNDEEIVEEGEQPDYDPKAYEGYLSEENQN